MKTLVIKALLVATLLMWASANHAEIEWLDKVIAIVEDDVILDSEFQRRLKTIKQQLAAKETKLPSEEAISKQVMERLILDQIQLQLAARSGVRVSDSELNAALERIAESTQTTVSYMKQELEAEGINYTLFREDIRNEMLISRVRQGSVSRSVFVSEQEVDDILKLMEDQGASNIQYHLRHLMIAISESASPSDVDKSREKIANIVERFKAGEGFAELVIAESDSSNALNGGDFGWKNIEQLPTLFAGSVRQLEIGQISEPIRSSNGLHILKLEDKKGDFEKQMVDEVNYHHIEVKISTVTSDAKAEAQLIEIRKEIIAGNTDFAEQAKVYSEDIATAPLGGDLGWAPPEAFKTIYGKNTDSLADGDLSVPFKGADGWYLVQRVASRTTDQTQDMKRSRARRILQSRKFEEEQETWLREIREQAYVKILKPKES
jgi:peptidyl-prolyl cis-trans isomerase SurA